MRNFPEADWVAPGPSHPPSRVWVLPSGGEQCDGTVHGDPEAEAEQKSGRWAGKVEASPRAGGHGVNGTGTWGGWCQGPDLEHSKQSSSSGHAF